MTLDDVIDATLTDLVSRCPAEHEFATHQRAVFRAPPTVMVTGRVNAGKSTLINALTGAPVAETAAIESTRVQIEYRDGAPSRAEVVAIDGTISPLPAYADRPVPVPASTVGLVRRWLPSAALRELQLVDTPGLATLTESVAEAAAAAVDPRRGPAAPAPDAALFLLAADLRADEEGIMSTWQFTPLTTIAVLARADSYGAGPFGTADPIPAARARAAELHPILQPFAAQCLAVSGLAAQAATTGTITESLARQVAALRDRDPWSIADEIPVTPLLADLAAHVGTYTLLRGGNVAAGGATALQEWLHTQSGITALRSTALTVASRYGPLRRALAAVRALEQRAHTAEQPLVLRAAAHTIRTAPPFAPAQMLSDYERMWRAHPRSPLTSKLRLCLEHDAPARQLGLPATATPHEVAQAAAAGLTDLHTTTAITSATAESARLTLVNAYHAILNEAR